ncbi:uncharacterized protein An02g00620 [Aspergillus niger]|uniref:Contig An02c0010, genomic contig n=2 Tax=Aspergillus niger TaxID=5061 RepID=A2QBN0_ASPNC|nr:uncharacterized protein An02g00620 [Aspergillus niger]CAK96277.1 unnamed protein product [Aspergillus niger]
MRIGAVDYYQRFQVVAFQGGAMIGHCAESEARGCQFSHARSYLPLGRPEGTGKILTPMNLHSAKRSTHAPLMCQADAGGSQSSHVLLPLGGGPSITVYRAAMALMPAFVGQRAMANAESQRFAVFKLWIRMLARHSIHLSLPSAVGGPFSG